MAGLFVFEKSSSLSTFISKKYFVSEPKLHIFITTISLYITTPIAKTNTKIFLYINPNHFFNKIKVKEEDN